MERSILTVKVLSKQNIHREQVGIGIYSVFLKNAIIDFDVMSCRET